MQVEWWKTHKTKILCCCAVVLFTIAVIIALIATGVLTYESIGIVGIVIICCIVKLLFVSSFCFFFKRYGVFFWRKSSEPNRTSLLENNKVNCNDGKSKPLEGQLSTKQQPEKNMCCKVEGKSWALERIHNEIGQSRMEFSKLITMCK